MESSIQLFFEEFYFHYVVEFGIPHKREEHIYCNIFNYNHSNF